jgi:hypothetical protein
MCYNIEVNAEPDWFGFFMPLAKFGKWNRLREFTSPGYCGSIRIATMSSPQLTNYLRTNRNRLALWQEETAFLLGFKGEDKGVKVCRDEKFTREPSLRSALAYEAIYGRSVRELFAGLYQQVEQEVAERAKLLTYRKVGNQNPKRHQTLASLISKPLHNSSQT